MSMTLIQKKVTPIASSQVYTHYQRHVYQDIGHSDYALTWKTWLEQCDTKKIQGLADFSYSDFCLGTSQAFDHFVLRHANRTIVTFPGEFQYHACISKHTSHRKISHELLDLQQGDALIISAPFSDLGTMHPRFDAIMQRCQELSIPVCLDLAYWGIARNIDLDLTRYPAVSEVVCSLSKPFYILGQHRVGIRFAREYPNDGISMQNEVGASNFHAMSLGCHFMQKFSADWCWNTYSDQYTTAVIKNNLSATDCVIFALSDVHRHPECNRGIPDNYRVCISALLE
jgi:hypothetical protein